MMRNVLHPFQRPLFHLILPGFVPRSTLAARRVFPDIFRSFDKDTLIFEAGKGKQFIS